MQIKTYTAVSMKDALTQIKSELGSNAVIVSTREIRESGYGLMSKPLIEVVAAVDYDEDVFMKRMQGRKTQTAKPDDRPQTAPILSAPGHIGDEIVELKKMVKQLMAQGKVNPAGPLREKLLARGIRANLADLVISKLGEEATEEGVKSLLFKLIRVEGPTSDRIRIFLGTTGVGKTTTIAKMAARSVLRSEERRVGKEC